MYIKEIFKRFDLYLISRILAALLQWLITYIFVKIKYSDIISVKSDVDSETKNIVKMNIKALFIHKIGGVLVNSVDSIIISSFLGVAILGKYSNYITIMSAMLGVITLFFTPLTSIIGHMFVKEDKVQVIKYYNFFYCFNFVLGCVFFAGYYSVIDYLISSLFGGDLILNDEVVFVIVLNYFIQYMRQSTSLFKDSAGIFSPDRYKPIIEGITNLILSIIFVLIFGVVGVIVATIITNLFICHIVEPHVLYKYGFEQKANKHIILNYIYILIFTIEIIIIYFTKFDLNNVYFNIMVNGFYSIGLSILIAFFVYISNKDFKNYVNRFFKKIMKKIR